MEHWQSKAQGSSTEKKLVSEIKQRGVELTEALEQSIARNEELEARLQQQAERCGHLEQTVLQLRESAGAAERAAHKGSKAGAARAAKVEEDVRQLQRVVELYKTLVSMEITLEAPRGGKGGRAAQGSSSSSSSSSSDSSGDASTIRCQCFRPGMGGGVGAGVEFTLVPSVDEDDGEEQYDFTPVRFAKDALPAFLQEEISFARDSAPMLIAKVMDAVCKSGE